MHGERSIRKWNPPCAGITLIRFCGYDLSRFPAYCRIQHPGNTEMSNKNKEDFFYRL
jgi:hypothetical protein